VAASATPLNPIAERPSVPAMTAAPTIFFRVMAIPFSILVTHAAQATGGSIRESDMALVKTLRCSSQLFSPERDECLSRATAVSARHVSMAIPEFVVELRRHIGHAPLWLPGATAVVIRDHQVLLLKRSDNLAWTPVTGIVEPGENPADCAVREVFEETGIHVVARRLASVQVSPPMIHANGDHARYLDLVFRMDWVSGEPFPADDESLEVRWVALAEMPDMSADMRRRVERASDDNLSAPTIFDTCAELDRP
jgi:8-oxo-dGTP pyrophosphatase MutT (NUDIX family)